MRSPKERIGVNDAESPLRDLYVMWEEASGEYRDHFFAASDEFDRSLPDGQIAVTNQATNREVLIPERSLLELREHGMIEYVTHHAPTGDFILTDRGIVEGRRLGTGR